MGTARSIGSEWTELSRFQASWYDYREVGGTIGTADAQRGRGDILEGLRFALLFSAIFWAALIAAGWLIF